MVKDERSPKSEIRNPKETLDPNAEPELGNWGEQVAGPRDPKRQPRKRAGCSPAALQNLAAWFALPTADFGFLSSFLLRIGFGFYHVSDGQNERKDAALVHDGFDGQSRFEVPGQLIDHG